MRAKTKQDGDMADLRKEMKDRFSTLEKEMKDHFSALEKETKDRFSALEKETKGLKDRVSALEKETKGLGDRVSALEKENEVLKKESKGLKKENERLKARILAQGARIASLEHRIHSIDIRVLLDYVRNDIVKPTTSWREFLRDSRPSTATEAVTAKLQEAGADRWNPLWQQPKFQELLLSNTSGTLRHEDNYAVHHSPLNVIAEAVHALPRTDERKGFLLEAVQILRDIGDETDEAEV